MKPILLTVAASALFAASAYSDVAYSTLGTNGDGTLNNQATTHYLEFVTLDPTAGQYSLDSLDVSIHWNGGGAGTQTQNIYAYVYTGGDRFGGNPGNPNTTVIGGSSFVAYGAVNLGNQPLGDYVYTLSLSADTNSQVPAIVSSLASLQVEFILTAPNPLGATQFDPATLISGNFTKNAPATDGTADTSVYSSADQSTYFTIADRTTFENPTEAVRFAINATPVPEPSAFVFSAVAGCALLGSFIHFRRSRAAV